MGCTSHGVWQSLSDKPHSHLPCARAKRSPLNRVHLVFMETSLGRHWVGFFSVSPLFGLGLFVKQAICMLLIGQKAIGTLSASFRAGGEMPLGNGNRRKGRQPV